jgi:hypothetical protein
MPPSKGILQDACGFEENTIHKENSGGRIERFARAKDTS